MWKTLSGKITVLLLRCMSCHAQILHLPERMSTSRTHQCKVVPLTPSLEKVWTSNSLKGLFWKGPLYWTELLGRRKSQLSRSLDATISFILEHHGNSFVIFRPTYALRPHGRRLRLSCCARGWEEGSDKGWTLSWDPKILAQNLQSFCGELVHFINAPQKRFVGHIFMQRKFDFGTAKLTWWFTAAHPSHLWQEFQALNLRLSSKTDLKRKDRKVAF